jgi:dienelactone hydrolase
MCFNFIASPYVARLPFVKRILLTMGWTCACILAELDLSAHRWHVRQSTVILALVCACAASLPCAAENLSQINLLEFIDAKGAVRPITSTNDWGARRKSILIAMQQVMGPLPGPEKRCALDVKIEEEVDCGTYVRRFLTYASEPGARVPAYLLIPKNALNSAKKFPAVLTLHQTHALGQKVVVGLSNSSNDTYGVELAQRGYVCLAPPYPLLANYNPDLKKLSYESGTMKAIWDNIRGLDLLEALPFVDHDRIGAMGHSLGGHNSIYTAAFDERIKVVVSSCGFDSYRDYKNGDITGWTSERYMPRLKNYAPDKYPFDFHEIIGALAPRALFVNAPVGDSNFKWQSVDAIANAARPVFQLFGVAKNVHIEHPACEHSFPKEMREKSYEFLAAHLGQPQ